MKSKQEFLEFTAEFSSVGSWAIWDPPGDKPRSNTEGMNWVTPDLWQKIKTDFVFVGLNLSSTHGDQGNEDWRNFHSSYSYQNDYKLRYALTGTKYWGSYLTDFIKRYKEVKSGEVIKMLKQNPKITMKSKKLLEKELSYFPNRPVLVAVGTAVFKLLKDNLGSKYNIIKIKHYSCRMGKEKYREEVLEALRNAE
jgi:hypothetical protein